MASNGLDFLNNFEQSKPDVVILDLNMPIMDGFETLIALRKIVDKSQLKIIIHSSDSEAAIQNYCIQNGANDFAVKGVPLSHLYKLILNQFQDLVNV